MSGPDLIAAAIRNRDKRLAQLAALHPVKKIARERADELGQQVDRAKRIGARARFVGSLKWAPGFFPTPPAVVRRMIEAGNIPNACQIIGEPFDPAKPEPLRILEPSCGTGNIAHALASLGHPVYCVEMVPAMAEHCRKEGLAVQCADFLTLSLRDFSFAEGVGGFDRVMMNPPFEKRQDEQHIRHAFSFLRPGGRLVAVCSCMTGARLADYARQHRGRVDPLPEDAFRTSERPTGVRTSLVILNR